MDEKLRNIVFTGFNSRVVALDQNTGNILWNWVSPKGSGYVSLLLADPEHLVVSVNGYTYCLDPETGRQRWFNELSGHGTGIASLISVANPNSAQSHTAAAAAEKDASDAAASTVVIAST